MIYIDWKKDYKREFVCPRCDEPGMSLFGWSHSTKDSTRKRAFKCVKCGKQITDSWDLSQRNSILTASLQQEYKNSFACPNANCDERAVRFKGFDKRTGKRVFSCTVCRTATLESLDLTAMVLSRHASARLPVKPFNFVDDKWDLRSLLPSIDERDIRTSANFETVQQEWFRVLVKNYIYHQCKIDIPVGTVYGHLSSLRVFSRYLAERELSRDTILDFLFWYEGGKDGLTHKLIVLRQFFWIGTIQGWFEVEQDLIRDDDYPKQKVSNPDPLSDVVRQQIESNLHKLPDPIARMWLICFFAAMRPAELALLKKDCLVQEGDGWKLVWWRKKGKNQHEVPITRVIARVIQEQQEYVQQIWGDDWDYLFCHYHGFFDSSSLELQPVKKVIPTGSNTLKLGIRWLIDTENIRDENGGIAQFSPKLVRPTRLTQLFEQGHDLAVVSAWAGHKSKTTTAIFYTQVSCQLIEKEAGHIQNALFNVDGQYLRYESLPKSFWENPRAHELNLAGDHINTPIYGSCGLPLDQDCDKFRACYTCHAHFVAVPEKLPLYIKTRNELREKETRAQSLGADVLVEQYQRQANQLDKIIAGIEKQYDSGNFETSSD